MYLLKRRKLTCNSNGCKHSHSTMYLLKPTVRQSFFQYIQFTFHHVSIKTFAKPSTNKSFSQFTFHHVSIKTYTTVEYYKNVYNSHSTMYLLKPTPRRGVHLQRAVFTFHHVSIKTPLWTGNRDRWQNSHSTMYLLKHIVYYYLFFLCNIHIPPCIY